MKKARLIVSNFLKNPQKISQDLKFEERFCYSTGIFVTILKDQDLRGCVGYPYPSKKLANALEEAAIAAATEDPRFSPLTTDEVNKIVFEVTVLSEPEIIEVENPEEYLDKIKIGRDGLIVKRGFNSGLLLPQVPLQFNWDKTQFLEYTCQKAGLEKDCWKEKDTEIFKFEGVIFSEKSPNGEIEKQEL